MRSLVSIINFLFEGREMLLKFAFIDLHSIKKRKACLPIVIEYSVHTLIRPYYTRNYSLIIY